MHIMLDLETWGVTPGSDLRSIGAVVFDPTINYVSEVRQFYAATDNPIIGIANYSGAPVYQYSLTRDPETVKWWNDQSQEAQAAFANPVELQKTCEHFSSWFNRITFRVSAKLTDVRLWCKGPHFDIAILEAVYRAVSLPVPWHYRSPRDMRTVADLAGITKDEEKTLFTGTPHNALDDAISQAKIVCEAYRRLGLNG